MLEVNKISEKTITIPIIVDVERNIDEYQMIRCSYYTIQADEPITNLQLNIGDIDSPIFLLNLEAILIGAPNKTNRFETVQDIAAMYAYVEQYDELFVDINDLWVPVEWFGQVNVKQGMIFRIPADRFIRCWKLRNDRISTEEMFRDEDVKKDAIRSKFLKKPIVEYSEETDVFIQWIQDQINQSRDRYNKNKEQKKILKKIKE